MQDPFRPEPSPQFVREVRIGLSLLLLMLGLFVYMVYFKLTGGGVRPNEYDRVPVAVRVWPNDQASETDRKLERLLSTDFDEKLAALRREYEQRQNSPVPQSDLVRSEQKTSENENRDIVRSRSVNAPSLSTPLDQNDLRGSLAATPARHSDEPIDSKQNDRQPFKNDSTATLSQPLTLHQHFAAAKRHRVTVQPRMSTNAPVQGRTRLPIQVTGDPQPNEKADSKTTASRSSDQPVDPSQLSSVAEQSDNSFQPRGTDRQPAAQPRGPQPFATVPAESLATNSAQGGINPATINDGFKARQPTSLIGAAPYPERADRTETEASNHGLLSTNRREHPQPLRPMEAPVRVDRHLRNAAFNSSPQSNEPTRPATAPQQSLASESVSPLDNPTRAPKRGSNQAAYSASTGTRTLVEGESLWSVAQQEYGDGRYFRALFAHNRARLENMNQTGKNLAGMTLHIPPPEELIRLWPSLCPRDESADEIDDTQQRFYVTSQGDTLFEIARQRLGQAFLYLEIYETNQFRLPDGVTGNTPLPSGLRLVLPLR